MSKRETQHFSCNILCGKQLRKCKLQSVRPVPIAPPSRPGTVGIPVRPPGPGFSSSPPSQFCPRPPGRDAGLKECYHVHHYAFSQSSRYGAEGNPAAVNCHKFVMKWSSAAKGSGPRLENSRKIMYAKENQTLAQAIEEAAPCPTS